MSFLFASSHLPAVRSARPELEDEEEEVNPESLPRSGGVRASSHLEQRVPEAARSADGSPAPRRADAASDWPGRLKEPMPPQRMHPDSAEPDQRPRRSDAEREPDAEPDHDADEAPGGDPGVTPGQENTRTWYQTPKGGAYDTDPGFHLPPEDISPESPDHGFDQHPPEGEESRRRDAWGDDAAPSSQEWGARRSNEIQDQPPGGQRRVEPGVPPGSTPASRRTGAFPNSRLFEIRPHPALAGNTGADSVQRKQGGQARAGSRFYDDAQPAADIRASAPPKPRPSPPLSRSRGPLVQKPISSPAPHRTYAQSKSGAPTAQQKPAAQPQLTKTEQVELFDDKGRPRQPVGQLGIRGGNGKTGPKTICLYDGAETRKQCDDGKCIADKYSLLRAAQFYASNGAWVIDISNPNWQDQLKKIHEKFGVDRIMIFDHGGPGYQEFGEKGHALKPDSEAWKTITESILPGGDIVLTGCEVGLNDWRGDGASYLDELYRNSSIKTRPKIHVYTENVRHRELREQPSLTAGEERTAPLDP